MSDVCPVCGLPHDLCVCEDIAKETQRIRVYTETKRYRKVMTIIEGIDAKTINLKDIAKQLKTRLACGGTVKDGRIELQGDHTARIKRVLADLGFDEQSIDIIRA